MFRLAKSEHIPSCEKTNFVPESMLPISNDLNYFPGLLAR